MGNPGKHHPTNSQSMTDDPEPNRHLDLEGVYNLRDLGGYPTPSGRQTRWKMFLRCGSMHRMTLKSQTALIDHGVRTIIDLRTTQETQEQPNVFAQSSAVTYQHYNMIGDEPLDESSVTAASGEIAEQILNSYRTFLDQRKRQIGQILVTLSSPDTCPVVFHCAGGKDRTGIISALLLEIAGVPRHLIAQDYGLSARYLLERYCSEHAPPGVSAENFTWQDFQRQFCPPQAMVSVLTYLQQQYNGARGYARLVGLTDNQINGLRDAILE